MSDEATEWLHWIEEAEGYLADVRALTAGHAVDPRDVPMPPAGDVPGPLAAHVASLKAEAFAVLADAETARDTLRERIAADQRWGAAQDATPRTLGTL